MLRRRDFHRQTPNRQSGKLKMQTSRTSTTSSCVKRRSSWSATFELERRLDTRDVRPKLDIVGITMFTLAKVATYASALPGVTVGTKWGRRTWQVGDQGFVWDRPLSKADIKRYGDADVPRGEILGVKVENLDAKDALLSMGLAGFFTIEHFNGYPAVLIELRLGLAVEVRQAIRDAWRTVAPIEPERATSKLAATTIFAMLPRTTTRSTITARSTANTRHRRDSASK